MAEIGSFGGVYFKCKRDGGKIHARSFTDLSASYSANYGEHNRFKKTPYIELTSLNSREYTLSVYSSLEWGYNPSNTRKTLWKYLKNGTPHYLVVGGKNICNNKLVITNMDVSYEVITPRGQVQRLKMDLTLREWVKKKKTKKKKAGKKKKKVKKYKIVYYVTQKGDTLWKISKKFYKTGKKWKKIYNQNKNVLSNTKPPRPGIKLKIKIANIKKGKTVKLDDLVTTTTEGAPTSLDGLQNG